MKNLITKGAAQFFVDLARHPHPLDPEERDFLPILNAQKHWQDHVFVLTDHSTMEFLYVSKNTKQYLGYTHQDILREGVDMFCPLIHPDDIQRISTVFRDFFGAYFSFPIEERLSFRYCNDLRIKGPDGKYVWWLQEVTFLKTDHMGRPLLSLSSLTNITSLKQDDSLNLYIGKYEDAINYTIRVAKHYPLGEELPLSKRELEILKLISDGYLSKQIADKLHISFHTVNTHRQHMLEKTHTFNSSDLIRYAYQHGLI